MRLYFPLKLCRAVLCRIYRDHLWYDEIVKPLLIPRRLRHRNWRPITICDIIVNSRSRVIQRQRGKGIVRREVSDCSRSQSFKSVTTTLTYINNNVNMTICSTSSVKWVGHGSRLRSVFTKWLETTELKVLITKNPAGMEELFLHSPPTLTAIRTIVEHEIWSMTLATSFYKLARCDVRDFGAA